jgi:hypothetical protein
MAGVASVAAREGWREGRIALSVSIYKKTRLVLLLLRSHK